MNYNLTDENKDFPRIGFRNAVRELYKYLRGSQVKMAVSFGFLLINSVTIIAAPFIIGDITNKYLPASDKNGLLQSLIFLSVVYLIGTLFSYLQIRIMGQVGQTVLFNIRNAVFNKLQSLPLQFFNQNKSGDLISRINNDTEKMNQAFSETLLRFTGDVVVIIGIAAVMIYLNATLGLIALATLGLMLLLTWVLAGWIKSRNDIGLQRLGELSGEIQESVTNFKVTVVFNRRDYFRESFARVNENNRLAATWAAIGNSMLAPIYNYAGTFASGVILVVGIQILILDKLAINAMPEFGSLLTFILYSSSFFGPLKELGDLFSQLQVAIASWSRIYRLLKLETNLVKIEERPALEGAPLMQFHNVSFGYDPETMILKKLNMDLEAGKTYALVGPTGGGKSTTAGLMVRLYDVSEGQILFKGKDIRSYEFGDLASQIGFILQEPFLFSGTIAENIRYGNEALKDVSDEDLARKLAELNLESLVNRFGEGLQTVINPGAENISLGQRQLISFVRVLLREPELLILDEATANVDTVTEKLLEEILEKLPASTTKVIIAHRLNTIERADQIFFISGGTIEKPLDFSAALGLINKSNGKS
jgi:ATP-binding cassette subfamily B protein